MFVPPTTNKRRLTRANQLRHLRDCDVKDLEYFLNSPARHRDAADVHAPAGDSPSQPLPLPDLSALFSSADKFVEKSKRPVDSDCFRLPSPTAVTKERDRFADKLPASSITSKVVQQDGRRSVDAQKRADARCRVDTRRAADSRWRSHPPETWSSSNTHQLVATANQESKNFRLDISFLSAPTSTNSSPMVSPQRMPNGDMFSSYHVEPNRQSDAAMSSSIPYSVRSGGTMVSLSRDSSPLRNPPVKSPKPFRKSTSGPASPRHPKLHVEISSSHNDNSVFVNVHPLPLPPMPASPPPASLLPKISPRTESLPVKNQWTKGKLIGRGTFGSVFVATHRETGALCAMKEVELCPDDPKSAECMRQLEQEINVLSHLKHPNIVQYYGSEIVDDKFYIYLEYIYPGSINKYVREHCGAITEAVVRNFTRHICSGLAYLHARKTIHRDIKGANLLVDSSGVVKLADFGMAKHLSGQVADLSLKGSPYWMAPELMQCVMQKDNNADLAFAIDIWSLGCTIIEMLTGKPPWSEFEGAAAMFKVLRESPPIPETLSPEGKHFLNCCFRRDPADRIPASKLLVHSFLKNSQHLDVVAPGPYLNLVNYTDKAHRPREPYCHKLGKVPMSPGRWAGTAKCAINETGLLPHLETSDITVGPRHSPKSILEPVSILSPYSPMRISSASSLLVLANASHSPTLGANKNALLSKLWT